MNCNLKNMPDAPSKEVIAWREEFKKELQEMRDKHARVHPCTECDKYFEEILGE